MKYQTMTAAQAILHFAANEYGAAWVEIRKEERERDRVRKIIHDAKRGRVSDKRAKALLEKYGGDCYKISTTFEVAITETKT